MKKTNKILSAVCAALMAAQVMAAGVSAAQPKDNLYYYYNGIYYTSYDDVKAVCGNDTFQMRVIPEYYAVRWYNAVTNTFSTTPVAGYNPVFVATAAPSAGTSAPSTSLNYNFENKKGHFYSSNTGKYYSDLYSAYAASNGNSYYITQLNGANGQWYNTYTGLHYMTEQDARNASAQGDVYVVTNSILDGSVSNIIPPTETIVTNGYKGYYYKGKYYDTLYAAIKAGGQGLGIDITYIPYNYYYNRYDYGYYYNGKYYATLDAAIKAGGHGLGIDITYVPYSYYYDGYYGYHYNGYYYYFNNGTLIDPYNILNGTITGFPILNTNTSSSSSAKAEYGTPYINGKKNRAGWDVVKQFIESTKKGGTVNVNMNGAVSVDSSVMKALAGKNVNVVFILENGVKWTINGKNITDAQKINIDTEYNIDYIPKKLVNKATKDAVAKAQIGISDSFASLGTSASVTVKFNKERAGSTVVVYRYDNKSNSLKSVSKAKVQSDGSCTFTVKAGGPYLCVIK
ncbi:MAG: hypothetical protein ACI4Q6_00145 [Huintestinicola sp.]